MGALFSPNRPLKINELFGIGRGGLERKAACAQGGGT